MYTPQKIVVLHLENAPLLRSSSWNASFSTTSAERVADATEPKRRFRLCV